ncbi:MAG: hypothetical protein RMK18_09790 [Armatimonadota bacterium]|nr:hypothetical protein [Armatimonadota bacterium]MDW8026135.1 hypothetical protein [Armatimonadota bacterium]
MNIKSIRQTVGMVIPVWFDSETPKEQIEELLFATLEDWEVFVLPERVVIVLDGCDWCLKPIRQVQRILRGDGWSIIVQERNTGKGGAVVAGIECLLAIDQPEFIAIRDSDNDHWLADLPRLWQLAKLIERERQTDKLLVIGRRNELHFPMSFSRGEWERIADEILLEAAKFALAKDGKVPDLTFCSFHTFDPPDFMSGYKLFTAQSAKLAYNAMREEHKNFPNLDLMRYGWEGVSCLSIMLDGGIVAEVVRMTYRRQPVTGYGDEASADLYGRQIAYALRRCGLKGEPARLLFDNAARRSLLWTQQPHRTVLSEVRKRILTELDAFSEIPEDELRFF